MTTLYKLDLNMTSNNSNGYIASASSVYNNRQPYKCFNNKIDKTSCYHSNVCYEGYVQIYLGKPYIITKSIINMRRLYNAYSQKSLTVYGSNDGNNFDKLGPTIDTSVWDTSVIDSEHTILFNKDEKSYKYYRFKFTATGSHYITINEISLYYKKPNTIIKTPNKYIGGGEFSLDTPLLDIKNNDKLISLTEIVTELKNINEPYKIIKIV